MNARFGYLPVASALVTQDQVDELITDYIPVLNELGGERSTRASLDHPKPLLLFVVSGGTEQQILELGGARTKAAPSEPILLLAHPGSNSLPASLEVLARLQQEGKRGRIFYLQGPEDRSGLQQIKEGLQDVEVQRALQATRLGLIGKPSDWLVASSPDPTLVQQAWGPKVVPIALDELIATFQGISKKRVEADLESIIAQADEVREPDRAQLEDVARVYYAIRELIERYKLDALTVRCFDLVMRLRTTGCTALAGLIDEGVIAGCEGDLVSTLGMLWVHKLLGQVPWMANPSRLDEERNTLWLAHCTVPISLVRGYRLRSHFESGLGVGIQGEFSAGPVTLLRLGGKALDQLWLAEGEIVRAGYAENLCRTQVEIRLTRHGSVSDLLRKPLGNHLVLVRGHHANRLLSWWQMIV